jgi:hypothetical protein
MPGRLLRRSSPVELAESEGPFVSFTDLFIGILFLFLILVAALMLMHQEAIQMEQTETEKMQTEAERMSEQIRQLQAKLDAVPKPKPDQPEFKLGIVFNIYQRADGANWTYSRTVRVFRAPSGVCINTVWMRSNLSVGWMPPVADEDIPTSAQKNDLRSFKPCGISASGDHWQTSTETGNLKRVSKDLYRGDVVLHKTDGDARLEMQYRVLATFDNYFR